jgi:glycosyltransferase involved in cell wall biosynthesis
MTTTPQGSRSTVSVALATYNGARYLRAFLDSLDAQTMRNFEIIASDDASRDATVAILNDYHALPVRVIEHATNQGVLRNFEDAIAGTSTDYVFFADQDDYWEANKIERMTTRLCALEAEYGRDHPLLVFCDLRIVDANLDEIESSYFHSTGKAADAVDTRDYIISNHVPGCAMAVNRALIKRATPIPPDVYLHDWWFMLVATIFGKVEGLPEPLIRYRQHGNNTVGFVGAPGSRLSRLWGYTRKPSERVKARVAFYRSASRIVERNVTALHDKFGAELPLDAQHLLDALASPRWRNRLRALRGAKTGESRIATLMMTALMWQRDREMSV